MLDYYLTLDVENQATSVLAFWFFWISMGCLILSDLVHHFSFGNFYVFKIKNIIPFFFPHIFTEILFKKYELNFWSIWTNSLFQIIIIIWNKETHIVIVERVTAYLLLSSKKSYVTHYNKSEVIMRYLNLQWRRGSMWPLLSHKSSHVVITTCRDDYTTESCFGVRFGWKNK